MNTPLPEKWSVPLRLGFSVIPVEPNGKKPLAEWKAFMNERADAETIARWAANDSNVGIITGRVSGVVVLDFDDERAEIEAKRRGLPETVTARTSRGRHYFFNYPDRPIRKPKGFPSGMDVQSDHKFVVAPGSLHPSGTVYEWENDPDIFPLADLPDWLLEPPGARAPGAVERDPVDEGPIITPRTIDELRDALSAIDADERELWIRIGMALKTLPADKGRSLWIDWSKKSKKYDAADAERVWESMRPEATSFRAVFTEAMENWNWRNPRKKDRDAAAAGSLRSRQIDLGERPDFYPTEFVIDGFMPVGVSVIAGAWGAGKSTNLIPLMASVAHLAPEAWGFRPDIRRPVIWVTEAAEQARDTLASIRKAEGSADWQEFREWFRIYASERKEPEEIAAEVKAEVEALLRTENGFKVRPVVVLDTTTANIEIESENDNAMVGRSMSILKQSLRETPVVLIGHTPKAYVKADVADMTFRGAGAWEAEAAATYFLVYDQETESRFLAIRKCRFAPTYREVSFETEGGTVMVETPWGRPQNKAYLHGVPRKSNGEERKAAKREIAEQRRERTLTERQERVRAFVSECAAEGRLATRKDVVDAVTGKRELIFEAINRLIEDGALAEHPVDRHQFDPPRSGAVPNIILPAEVDLEAFLSARTGKGNQSPENGAER